MFPYEYQRALRQLAEEAAAEKKVEDIPPASPTPTPPPVSEQTVRDIEETVYDTALATKKEKILDKTRYLSFSLFSLFYLVSNCLLH